MNINVYYYFRRVPHLWRTERCLSGIKRNVLSGVSAHCLMLLLVKNDHQTDWQASSSARIVMEASVYTSCLKKHRAAETCGDQILRVRA